MSARPKAAAAVSVRDIAAAANLKNAGSLNYYEGYARYAEVQRHPPI